MNVRGRPFGRDEEKMEVGPDKGRHPEGVETPSILVRRELRDDGNHLCCYFYFVCEYVCKVDFIEECLELGTEEGDIVATQIILN